MDYLKSRAKSGDMAVLELTFRNVSLGKWSKTFEIDPATGVRVSSSRERAVTQEGTGDNPRRARRRRGFGYIVLSSA